MWTHHHCRHCGDKHKPLSPKPLKKYKFEKLLALVRSFVNSWDENKPLYKEQVAYTFQCKTHLIEQCFNILNREGILNQPTHSAPHDSTRAHFFCGGDSAWCGDRYYKRKKL